MIRASVRCLRWMLMPIIAAGLMPRAALAAEAFPDRALLQQYCSDCHDADTKKGGLDLDALAVDLSEEHNFAEWEAIHDRLANHEMPPAKKPQPPADGAAKFLAALDAKLIEADTAQRGKTGRAVFRRLTRTEYENALRDLLDLPDLNVKDLLPPDGTRHHLDKIGGALDFSSIQLEKYLEAADRALDAAIATRATPPPVFKRRIYPGSSLKFLQNLAGGNAILLSHQQIDPIWPPTGTIPNQNWADNFNKAIANGVRNSEASVAVFHPDMEGWRTSFNFAPVFAGPYKLTLSTWSLWWNAGKVEPARKTEVATLHIGPRTLGYFDGPSLCAQQHELTPWLGRGDEIIFDAASLYQPGQPIIQHPGGAAAYVGPAIALDWLDVEGPIYPQWPPQSHRRLFGNLPLAPMSPTEGVRPPARTAVEQKLPWCIPAIWEFPPAEAHPPIVSVASKEPLHDAAGLLNAFLPRAFRRDVTDAEVKSYVDLVAARLNEKCCFEDAMRYAYKAALTSPHFLFRCETPGPLNGSALATRLAFWLWNTTPDDALLSLAREGALRQPAVLDAQVERMLRDPRSSRFVANFLDEWLNLQSIDATDPDHDLYPEFNLYLKESMLGESRAFFGEMVQKDLSVANLIASDFVMINQRLAEQYGIAGVEGCALRRVAVPANSHRGGFLTQGSVLKVTANGTVSSPVVRGIYVSERFLGQNIPPQPAGISAIDPDTRGATTIRQQLEKHRSSATCAACHARLDPPGLALENYDVIGGWRDHYRSLGAGLPVASTFLNGQAVPYKCGPAVDASGRTASGESYKNFTDFQRIVLAHPDRLARNLACQLLAYATGAEPSYSDRREIDRILAQSESSNYGLRTLIHAISHSELFLTK